MTLSLRAERLLVMKPDVGGGAHGLRQIGRAVTQTGLRAPPGRPVNRLPPTANPAILGR
jgi:hypothetical protein